MSVSGIDPIRSVGLHPVTADARVRALGEALGPQPAAQRGAAVQVDAEAPAPDPRVLLEEERKRVLRTARQQGYEEGHAEGMRDAETAIEALAAEAAEEAERIWRERFESETERLANAAARFEALAHALPEALSALERRLERVTVEATFAATTRVVAAAAVDRSLILGLCREALADHAVRPAVLRVRPDALQTVQEALTADGLRIEADPRLAPGQCRIESARGLYDVSVLQRLDALRDALLDALHAQSSATDETCGAEEDAA